VQKDKKKSEKKSFPVIRHLEKIMNVIQCNEWMSVCSIVLEVIKNWERWMIKFEM